MYFEFINNLLFNASINKYQLITQSKKKKHLLRPFVYVTIIVLLIGIISFVDHLPLLQKMLLIIILASTFSVLGILYLASKYYNTNSNNENVADIAFKENLKYLKDHNLTANLSDNLNFMDTIKLLSDYGDPNYPEHPYGDLRDFLNDFYTKIQRSEGAILSLLIYAKLSHNLDKAKQIIETNQKLLTYAKSYNRLANLNLKKPTKESENIKRIYQKQLDLVIKQLMALLMPNVKLQIENIAQNRDDLLSILPEQIKLNLEQNVTRDLNNTKLE